MGRNDFSDQLGIIIIRHKRIGYDLNVMRQPACLVINPFMIDNFAALFNCTSVDRASNGPDLKLFILVGWDWSSFVCCLVHRDSTDDHLSSNTLYLLSPRLCFFIGLKRDLFVYRDDSFTS